MDFRRPRRESPEINITSLIDIIFIILIFLLLTTTFNPSTGIEVKLPEATRRELPDKSQPVYLGVTKDGRYFVGKRQYAEADLEEALKQVARERPGALLIVRADADARHAKVVEAMDLAKSAGIGRMAIEAKGK